MSRFAVELYFDEDGEARVRTIWRALAEQGTSAFLLDAGARPHVSLAVLDDTDLDTLLAVVSAFSSELPYVRLEIASVGAFPTPQGVIFLAPVVDENLLAVHAELCDRLALEGIAPNRYYQPGAWVPHCTVAQHVEAVHLGAALSLTLELARDFEALEVVEIGVVEVGTVTPLLRLMADTSGDAVN